VCLWLIYPCFLYTINRRAATSSHKLRIMPQRHRQLLLLGLFQHSSMYDFRFASFVS
jgi:hypothetical protein